MKKERKFLWKGIKAVFTAVVDWIATLFGMKENSRYGRVLHRIVGTAFAVVLILLAAGALVRFCRNAYWNIADWCGFDDRFSEVSFSEAFNENLYYYEDYWSDKGYLTDSNGHKLLKHISCIAKPMEGDSLVYFSDGDKRGYFHMRDGHLVVKPIYEHAWVFSEGLAAVEVNGQVKFINTEGRVVIDRGFAFCEADDGYVFHNGHCAVNDCANKKMGLIDRNGDWVVPPIYSYITPQDTFWILAKGNQQAILTFGMDTVIPLAPASFSINDTTIEATLADHTLSTYTLQGRLITSSQIRDVTQLKYYTQELVYPDSHSDDEYYDHEPYTRMAVATCLCYEAECDWYGLMSPDGKLLTPPSYISIEAVGKDLYLCKTNYDRGVLLNSKGICVQ